MPTGSRDRTEHVPSRVDQAAIAIAFRKMVLTQKAPDGSAWTTSGVLEKLWNLWEERPCEAGSKAEYLSPNGGRFYQRIDRLKRGVTRSLHDNILFGLVQKFVSTYGLPGRTVPPAVDVRLLHEAAQKLSSFCFSGKLAKISHDDEHTPRSGWSPLYDIPMERIIPRDWFEHPQEEGSSDFVFVLSEARKTESGQKRVILRSMIIAIRVKNSSSRERHREHYWPLIAFDATTADYEIGFYLRNLSTGMLRSITVTEYGRTYQVSGVTRSVPVALRNARMLDFFTVEDREDGATVWAYDKCTFQQSDAVSTDPPSHGAYAVSLTTEPQYKELAGKLLNFLDVK